MPLPLAIPLGKALGPALALLAGYGAYEVNRALPLGSENAKRDYFQEALQKTQSDIAAQKDYEERARRSPFSPNPDRGGGALRGGLQPESIPDSRPSGFVPPDLTKIPGLKLPTGRTRSPSDNGVRSSTTRPLDTGDPPFKGGQIPGQVYRVRYRVRWGPSSVYPGASGLDTSWQVGPISIRISVRKDESPSNGIASFNDHCIYGGNTLYGCHTETIYDDPKFNYPLRFEVFELLPVNGFGSNTPANITDIDPPRFQDGPKSIPKPGSRPGTPTLPKTDPKKRPTQKPGNPDGSPKPGGTPPPKKTPKPPNKTPKPGGTPPPKFVPPPQIPRQLPPTPGKQPGNKPTLPPPAPVIPRTPPNPKTPATTTPTKPKPQIPGTTPTSPAFRPARPPAPGPQPGTRPPSIIPPPATTPGTTPPSTDPTITPPATTPGTVPSTPPGIKPGTDPARPPVPDEPKIFPPFPARPQPPQQVPDQELDSLQSAIERANRQFEEQLRRSQEQFDQLQRNFERLNNPNFTGNPFPTIQPAPIQNPTIQPVNPTQPQPPIQPAQPPGPIVVSSPEVALTTATVTAIATAVKQETNCKQNPNPDNNNCPTVRDVFDLIRELLRRNNNCDDIVFIDHPVTYTVCQENDGEIQESQQTQIVKVPSNSTGNMKAFTDVMITVMNKLRECEKLENAKRKEPILAIPQSWEIKSQGSKQAVVLWSDKDRKSYWSFSIPHFKENSNLVLPKYKKGSYYGKLVLKDNSQFVIYAFNQSEAEKMINAVIPYINSSMISNPPVVTYGQKQGIPFVEIEVEAIRVMYYSKGIKNTKPDWVQYLDESTG